MPKSNSDFSGKIQIPPICTFKVDLKIDDICVFRADAKQLSNCLEIESSDLALNVEGFVLIDARKHVEQNSNEIAIFGPIKLMHGATAFHDALAKSQYIKCVAILSGETIKEINHQKIEPQSQRQFGTLTERLEIDHQWVKVTIISEPFITLTAFGYAPALLVRTVVNKDKHILAGAKSLSSELEKFRHPKSGLTGITVKIRKAGNQKTDPYEVEIVSRP